MKRKAALLVVLASACAIGVAQQITTSKEVAIRTKPDKLARAIVRAPANAKLDRLEDKGDFIRVKYQGHEGWIRLADLSESDRTRFAGSDRASALQESAASKGLEEDTLAFARSANLDPTPLRNLQQRRQDLIDSGKYEQFAAEAKVGAR